MQDDSSVATASNPNGRKVFRKMGTCSRTFFYILNREYGHLKDIEERAADALAGGIMQKGHQCGMLWGSALAVGAESYRRYNDPVQASYVAINATQRLMESFTGRTKTVLCREITGCDFSSKLSMAKYFFSGRFLNCFTLAEKWAPEAIKSASEGLEQDQIDEQGMPISCASEVVKNMGGNDEEVIMASGFAGGLGLSGNACGALSAAIWMNSLRWLKNHDAKSSYTNPLATNTLKTFNEQTECEISCKKITGSCFNSIKDHAEFIKYGGCKRLMTVLAESSV